MLLPAMNSLLIVYIQESQVEKEACSQTQAQEKKD